MTAVKFEFETETIRVWAETGLDIVVRTRAEAEMLALGIGLVDVNYLLKTGEVVSCDMLGSRGLWKVYGETLDGVPIEMTITIVSSAYEVELLQIVGCERKTK